MFAILPDSNRGQQNQSLRCYRYTKDQNARLSGLSLVFVSPVRWSQASFSALPPPSSVGVIPLRHRRPTCQTHNPKGVAEGGGFEPPRHCASRSVQLQSISRYPSKTAAGRHGWRRKCEKNKTVLHARPLSGAGNLSSSYNRLCNAFAVSLLISGQPVLLKT